MDYSLLRLLLVQRDINAGRDQASMNVSRHDYLMGVFSQNITFIGARSNSYIYAFIGSVDSFILGRVGRQISEVAHKGPETGFSEVVEQRWRAANILIDARGERNGQKVAIQDVQGLGSSSFHLVESLVEEINTTHQDAWWEISVQAITQVEEFWAVVDRYKGNITELELQFVAPNILGSRDDTTKTLRKLRDENNMQTTTVSLKNRDGKLNPNSENIHEGIALIGEGGGRAKLRTGKKTVYSSQQRALKESVDDEEDFSVSKKNKTSWSKLLKKFFKL